MEQLVASYLFDRPTQLNAVWTRRTGITEEFWTRDTVPGRRFGGTKPVYVLTSSATFSAEIFVDEEEYLRLCHSRIGHLSLWSKSVAF